MGSAVIAVKVAECVSRCQHVKIVENVNVQNKTSFFQGLGLSAQQMPERREMVDALSRDAQLLLHNSVHVCKST